MQLAKNIIQVSNTNFVLRETRSMLVKSKRHVPTILLASNLKFKTENGISLNYEVYLNKFQISHGPSVF